MFFTNEGVKTERGAALIVRAKRTKAGSSVTNVPTEKLLASNVNQITRVGGTKIPMQCWYGPGFPYMSENMGSEMTIPDTEPRKIIEGVYEAFRMQLPEISKRTGLRRNAGNK
ncbi:hypothetical protein D3C78_1526470 [compost metagenome]